MPKKRRTINWNKAINEYKEKEEKTYVKNDGYSENLFVPKLDDKGQYQAIMRFLPRPENDGNGVPFVKLYNHGFRGTQGWFIENCPTTLKKDCPVCKSNQEIWDDDEDTARFRGRRTSYFSNVLIITDPQNKENEGKVFIFRYGKTLHDMIMDKISPDENSIDEKIHVHDYDEGLNFKLKIKPKKTGKTTYNDYSTSTFVDSSTPIAETEKEIDVIDNSLHALEQIVGKDKFKTYDVLQTSFLTKIGQATIPKDEAKNEGGSETKTETKPEMETVSGNAEAPDAFFEKLNNEK